MRNDPTVVTGRVLNPTGTTWNAPGLKIDGRPIYYDVRTGQSAAPKIRRFEPRHITRP